VHTGEVEVTGAKYGGIAVHIGARLLALAGPQQVLVSSTVRDLVTGSGHAFDDHGVHELKGVPGEWRVYSLALPRFEEGVPLVGVDDEELRAVAARRQRVVVAALVVVIAVLVAALGGAYLIASRPASPARGPNTLAVFDPSTTDAVRGLTVDPGPSDVAVGDGSYWTTNIDAGTVSRVDSATGEVNSFANVGSRPSAVTLTPGRVWVSDRYSSRVTVLDRQLGTLLSSLPLHASAMAAGDGQLWISDDIGDRVMRLDPASGAQVSVVELSHPAGPTGLALAGGSLWIAAPRSGNILRLDPATGAFADAGLGLADVRSVASLGDDLWLASPTIDRVARVDLTSGRIAVSADVCDTPVDIAPTPTGAWLVCAVERELWRIDRAGSVVVEIELDAVPTAVAVDGERAVVTLRAD
jgi:hypothetical protein